MARAPKHQEGGGEGKARTPDSQAGPWLPGAKGNLTFTWSYAKFVVRGRSAAKYVVDFGRITEVTTTEGHRGPFAVAVCAP